MASNGVILLNLNNRNAADFQRMEVPDAYEKASGALTAGTYVTVYKWLYQGFMVAPSLCDAVDATDHINLVDRTNGGILEVYPDDTITIPSTPEPEPPVQNISKMLVIETDRDATPSNIEYSHCLYDLSGETPTVLDVGTMQSPKDTEITFDEIEGYVTVSYEYTSVYASYRFVIVPSVDIPYLGHTMYHVEESSTVSRCGIMTAGDHYIISNNVNTLQLYKESGGSDFPEFNMGGVDFVGQSFGPSNIMTLISDAIEESFIVMATNFSVEGDLKGATLTSVSKFKDSDNQTFYTMENEFFKYSASESPFGQAYVEFYIKEE